MANDNFFESVITERRMAAIDRMIEGWNIKTIYNRINKVRGKLNNALKKFDINMPKNTEYSMAKVREELSKINVSLLPVASEAYYLIGKIKDAYNGAESLYTLGIDSELDIGKNGAMSTGAKLEIATVGLKDVIHIMSQIGATAHSREAVLRGSVSLKYIDPKAINKVNESDLLLYQQMIRYEQQTQRLKNKGKLFEAFEIAKSKKLNAALTIEDFNNCCTEASGNIPFFKLAGDVEGRQVKYGGFSFCRAKTCLTVLGWLQKIFELMLSAPNDPRIQKMLMVLFEETTSMQTTKNRLELIVNNIALDSIDTLIIQPINKEKSKFKTYIT